MQTIPQPRLVLGYKEVFKEDAPKNRLSIISHVCKRNLVAEFAGLNYRLKPKAEKYYDTSLDTQAKELEYFCGGNAELFRFYSGIAERYTTNAKQYPLIFIRQTCLFALEEIIQSDLEVIDDFNMNRTEVWGAMLIYILAVNSELTSIKETQKGEPIDFERLNPKMLPMNELSLSSDPLYIPYRGFNLLSYLHTHTKIGPYLDKYLAQTYTMSYDQLVFEVLSMYFANTQDNKQFEFHYILTDDTHPLFCGFSQKYVSTDILKLLSIRKYPFFKSREKQYILTDNILLLEKVYSQFINDFWFDFLKQAADDNGRAAFNIQNYKSAIGYFFESYVAHIIDYAFTKAKHYCILKFDELKTIHRGNQIEVADLYIRANTKIILGEVKSTSLYDNEKYSGNIDSFYKNDRNKFFDSFGVDQIVKSIKTLNETMPNIDNNFPSNKYLRIYPVIIFNEKAFQTPLMAKIFNDRFSELMKDFQSNKIHVYPLSLIHISDLENLQEYLASEPQNIWDLLGYHCRAPAFMPPFYNSLSRKDIRANYKRIITLYEDLVRKYGK